MSFEIATESLLCLTKLLMRVIFSTVGGNLTGEEMLRRFWEAACRGGYPGHGETYLNKENILWWSHGGILHGESHKRFGFLLDRLKETPGLGLMPYSRTWDEVCAVPQEITPGEAECGCKEYYLIYYSFMRPTFREFHLMINQMACSRTRYLEHDNRRSRQIPR